MECRNCQVESPDSNTFCGKCGSLLAPDPVIQAAIKEEIKSRLQDRNVVEVEVAEKVYDHLTKWGTTIRS